MPKTSKSQKGFAHLTAIGLVLIIAVAGFAGWRVWQVRKEGTKPSAGTAQPTTPSAPKTTSAPVTKPEVVDTEASSWVKVESKLKAFSIRIPDGWTVTSYGQADDIKAGNTVTYSKGTPAKINETATPYAGDGLFRFEVMAHANGFENEDPVPTVTKTDFNTTTLTGIKLYGVYPLFELQGVGPIPGMERYVYNMTKNGKTVSISYIRLIKNKDSEGFLKTNYNQTESDQNQKDLIERVVKTLEIN